MAGGSKGAAAIDSAPVTHAVLMAAPGLHTAAQVFGPLAPCPLQAGSRNGGPACMDWMWGREKADRVGPREGRQIGG